MKKNKVCKETLPLKILKVIMDDAVKNNSHICFLSDKEIAGQLDYRMAPVEEKGRHVFDVDGKVIKKPQPRSVSNINQNLVKLAIKTDDIVIHKPKRHIEILSLKKPA